MVVSLVFARGRHDDAERAIRYALPRIWLDRLFNLKEQLPQCLNASSTTVLLLMTNGDDVLGLRPIFCTLNE